MNRASSSLVSTRKIVFAGLLIAMGIVLKMFEISVTPNFRIGFTTVPTIFSGILLGPIYGFAIGFLSDFIQFVIKSDGGAFHLGFTLTSALYGLIPGLIAMMVKRKNIELSLKHVVLIVVLCEIICSIILNTAFLIQMYGYATIAMIPQRLIKAVVMIFLNSAIIYFLYNNTKNKIKV
ncbi:folate family ECF transporter S component [Anaerofustis stercorihominis]|uniref:folate family ECF transporter S component n=1 Tax=Anaerofustis stercorihominis TaxID=214853 RepID=UPI00214BFD93|nr:folate family ECF transporter S component [Anaerofustis stercorihominis]MCR2033090.1 folate family ECF transporter S component [Anaerofustis stercorihominis]